MSETDKKVFCDYCINGFGCHDSQCRVVENKYTGEEVLGLKSQRNLDGKCKHYKKAWYAFWKKD